MITGPSITSPLVSIVLIFFNEARFLEEAIASVLAQTFTDWELLLVDDGSTDGSDAVARAYAASHPMRISYFTHDGCANRGPSASRNLAIERAGGRFLAFLDGDDAWLPDKLSEQLAILNTEPHVEMVFGHSQQWYSWTGRPQDVARDQVPP